MYINKQWQKHMEGMATLAGCCNAEAMRDNSHRYTFSRIPQGMVCHVISPGGRIVRMLTVEDGPPDYPLHSDRFDCGSESSAKDCAQMALTLIKAVTKSDALAIRWHQHFANEFLVKLPPSQVYTIPGAIIVNYVAEKERELSGEAKESASV